MRWSHKANALTRIRWPSVSKGRRARLPQLTASSQLAANYRSCKLVRDAFLRCFRCLSCANNMKLACPLPDPIQDFLLLLGDEAHMPFTNYFLQVKILKFS